MAASQKNPRLHPCPLNLHTVYQPVCSTTSYCTLSHHRKRTPAVNLLYPLSPCTPVLHTVKCISGPAEQLPWSRTLLTASLICSTKCFKLNRFATRQIFAYCSHFTASTQTLLYVPDIYTKSEHLPTYRRKPSQQ